MAVDPARSQLSREVRAGVKGRSLNPSGHRPRGISLAEVIDGVPRIKEELVAIAWGRARGLPTCRSLAPGGEPEATMGRLPDGHTLVEWVWPTAADSDRARDWLADRAWPVTKSVQLHLQGIGQQARPDLSRLTPEQLGEFIRLSSIARGANPEAALLDPAALAKDANPSDDES